MKFVCRFLLALVGCCPVGMAQDAIDLGGRRELVVDNLLVKELRGDARRVFHHPVAREVVMTFDQPWEGNTTIPTAIFQDGDMYRMYYRASNTPGSAGGEKRGAHEFDCYAESRDGIHWTRPQLQQREFQNSKDNNIIQAPDVPDGWSLGALNPFRDSNPRAEPDALFKAVTPLYGPGTNPDDWLSKEKGLAVLKSADGINWSLARQGGVFRNEGNFDSVNVAFWDPHRQEYRAYFRNAEAPAWFRDIKTGTSRDFTQWTQAVPLTYSTKPPAQFYTNGIRNYHRAPHLLVGFPGMYDDREWSPAMAQLPDTEKRRKNIEAWQRPGPLSEVHLMWSRDGTQFELSQSAFMRPGPERSGSWTYSDNVAWHLVETASNLEGAAPELTLYAHEFYYLGDVRLRRYTMRLDGFASIHASNDGGEFLTQTIVFQGNQLSLNFATSAFGSLRVEIQDQSGQPLPGFALADSVELYGDTVARAALWQSGPDLSSLAGKPIRLRFALRDADLYSIMFESNK